MAKKRSKKKNKSNKQYVDDSTLKKLKTVFEDKWFYLTRGGIAHDVRERVMTLDFQVLRNIARRLSVFNMCVNCREHQLTPFFQRATELGAPGFIVCKKGEFDRAFKRKKNPDKRADELTDFLTSTGFASDPSREDDFVDFGKMFFRELYTIDQVAIEIQKNRRQEVAAFWLIDGGTISRCFSEGYQGNKNIAFVQEVDGQIMATYTRDELIFDYMYKRAELLHRGYGYSILEQAVDLVTTLILGITYNRDLFIKDKIPKGFLAVQGEADDATIQALQRYWYMAMHGTGTQFNIPILPAGKEGVSIDFKNMGQSNRDMEYYKLMLFFLSLFAGLFGIDLAELGIKTDNTQQVLGENIAGRQEFSKNRALKAGLTFFASVVNKVLNLTDNDYAVHIVGIDPEDELKKYETQAKAIATSRTINEVREDDGQDRLEGEEYDTVLNAQLIQLKQILAGQQQQEDFGDEGGDEYAYDDEEETTKSKQTIRKHIESLQKAGYDLEIVV